MRITFFLIFLTGFCTSLIAQKNKKNTQKNNEFLIIDQIALQIPDSATNTTEGLAHYFNSKYSKQNEKARAIFIWITQNVEYDINNMFALNFYQNTKEIIDKVLKTRKGICMNYAELFNDIANKVGIKSYVVSGYTKQNGFVDYIPHAWCAAVIDSSWYLFDPTWGSGFIQNAKFVKQVNNYYFKTKPEQIIKSHMPFDPLWEFLNYPVTNQEFYEGNTMLNTTKPYFNFSDTLRNYEKQSDIERLVSESYRIEKNGIKNALVYDRLEHNRREIEYYRNKQIVEQYNTAVNTYNSGISLFNNFINYRNKQFTPKKSDPEIKQMLDTVETSYNLSREILKNIKNPESNPTLSISQINKSIDDAKVNLNEQKVFLEKYFKTGKAFRKSLFYTIK